MNHYKTTKYLVCPLKYTDRPRNARYHFDSIPANAKGMPSLTDARAYAYDILEHKKGMINESGKYLCIILRYENGLPLVGEVLNTVFNNRYWYPSNDGGYARGGKYPLYKDGTLGRRLR